MLEVVLDGILCTVPGLESLVLENGADIFDLSNLRYFWIRCE